MMKSRINISTKICKIVAILLSFLLIFEQSGLAQIAGQLDIAGYITSLRSSFTQDKFRPLHLRYLSYDNLNNSFKLLLDKGDFNKGLSPKGTDPKTKGTVPELESATKELLNYFFVGIALPNDSFWVNLRPDSQDNIIDDYLAQTDVGKILLEADLQLKKDTAQFTSPQTPEGKNYWDKLYQKAGELLGQENITIPTLVRPWIVPGEIIIRETKDNAYIYKATLKVMLEEDYLKGSSTYNFSDSRLKALNQYSSQLLKERIIPKLTKEINTSKRYAALRQAYYSLILAQWFKARFYGKGGLYSWLIDKRNLTGLISQGNWSKTQYFKEYQKSFKDGEYNLKEPVSTSYGQSIRSYFSGGIAFGQEAMRPAISAGTLPLPAQPRRSEPVPGSHNIGIKVEGGSIDNPLAIKIEKAPSLSEELDKSASSPVENGDSKKANIVPPATPEYEISRFMALFSKEGYTDHEGRAIRIKTTGLDSVSFDGFRFFGSEDLHEISTIHVQLAANFQHVLSQVTQRSASPGQGFLLANPLSSSELRELASFSPIEMSVRSFRNGQQLIVPGYETGSGGPLVRFLEQPSLAGFVVRRSLHNHPEVAEKAQRNLDGELVNVSPSVATALSLRPSFSDLALALPGASIIFTRSGLVIYQLHPGLSSMYRRQLVGIPDDLDGNHMLSDSYMYADSVLEYIDSRIAQALFSSPPMDLQQIIIDAYAYLGVYLKIMTWDEVGDQDIETIVSRAENDFKVRQEQCPFERIADNILNAQPIPPSRATYEQVLRDLSALRSRLRQLTTMRIRKQLQRLSEEGVMPNLEEKSDEEVRIEQEVSALDDRARFMAHLLEPEEVQERHNLVLNWLNIMRQVNAKTAALPTPPSASSPASRTVEDEQSRDIINIVEKYNVLFIHAIHHDYGVDSTLTLLRDDVNWETKLKILLGLSPTIATSTIKEGDTFRNMVARMGVILSGGSVVSAYKSDTGTVARGLFDRKYEWGSYRGNISDEVKEAVTLRDKEDVNELVVKNPEIAGFYICLDDTGSITRFDLPPVEKIAKVAIELGIPLYVIQNGFVYKAEYDPQSKRVVPKEQIAPKAIIQNRYQLSEMQKEKIIEELFTDSPFAKIKSPDMGYIDSWNAGMMAYVEINTLQNPKSFNGKDMVYERSKREWGPVIKSGKIVKVITEVPTIKLKIQYLVIDGELHRREEYKNGDIWIRDTEYIKGDYDRGHIKFGDGSGDDLKRVLSDKEAYLRGMEEAIKEVKQKRDQARQPEFYNDWLSGLVFHLYGFGEQAGRSGDLETQERAFALAQQTFPLDQYQDIINRRVGKNGEFRIRMEDLISDPSFPKESQPAASSPAEPSRFVGEGWSVSELNLPTPSNFLAEDVTNTIKTFNPQFGSSRVVVDSQPLSNKEGLAELQGEDGTSNWHVKLHKQGQEKPYSLQVRLIGHEIQHAWNQDHLDLLSLLPQLQEFQQLQERFGKHYDILIQQRLELRGATKEHYTNSNEILARLRAYQIYLQQKGSANAGAIEPHEFFDILTQGDLRWLDVEYLRRETKGLTAPAFPEKPTITISRDEALGTTSGAVGSPVQTTSDKGGVDFRALPITTQPVNSSANLRDSPLSVSGNSLRRGQSLSNVNLDTEWSQIQNMLQSGIIPSSERIKEYLEACSVKENMDKEIDKVLACIADIFRLEEERLEPTDQALKELLVLLESDKPASQIPFALSAITVLPKEPVLKP